MEKGKRLRLYSEKDYTETIDFPVELVGRDGVVRRYSYADSIRIYERRIESAHVRYRDREIINAEIYHCSKRLEQIRQSWKVRISSSERQFVEGRPGLKDRELYERGKQLLKAYLELIFAGIDAHPELGNPNLVNLEERGDFQIFYVNWPVFYPGTLLYVYRLVEPVADEMRQAYKQYLEVLRSTSLAPDTEKLVHHELSQDMAFILTSPRQEFLLKVRSSERVMVGKGSPSPRPEVPEEFEGLVALLQESSAPEEGPYRQGIDSLRRNDFEAAYGQFREALQENPFYKEAYWALATLTDVLGKWDETEPYLLMALKYFPEEPRSHFYYGLALMRTHRVKDAAAAFRRANQLNMRQSRAFGYLACTQALLGQYRAATETLEQGLQTFRRDRSLRRRSVPVQRAVQGRNRLLRVAVILLTSIAAVALISGQSWGWGLFGLISIALTAVWLHQERLIRRQLWAWTRPAG